MPGMFGGLGARLGGMFPQRDPAYQINNAVLMAGLGLMSGQNRGEQFQGAMQGIQAGTQMNQQRDVFAEEKEGKNATVAYLKRLDPNMTDADAKALIASPALLAQKFKAPDKPETTSDITNFQFAQTHPEFAKTLKEADENNGAKLFGASKAVDAIALQSMIDNGEVTEAQARQFAAGKTITGPDGSIQFLTPNGVFQNGSASNTIPLTPGKEQKPTEREARNQQLSSIVDGELSTVRETFPALASSKNTAGGYAYEYGPKAVGNALTTPEYQKGRNSLRTIAAAQIYSVSGATASPQEVDNLVDTLMPSPGESPEAVADKLARIEQMAAAIKAGSGPQSSPTSAGGSPATGKTTSGVGWHMEP